MNKTAAKITESVFFNRSLLRMTGVSIVIGLVSFIILLSGKHPERAWQAYLTNFLFWSSVAQGGLLFSAVMQVARGRWGRSLTGPAEALAGFFPVSFLLYLILFLGYKQVFPWRYMELGEKAAWLNLPGLFARDTAGFLILYGLGFIYLYHSWAFRLNRKTHAGKTREYLNRLWNSRSVDPDRFRARMTLFAVLYIIAYAVILSLIAYDLIMALDPHWYSALFGAYHFVKAFYMALGVLIILASILHMNPQIPFALRPSQFHDLGKLFFAFCLVWADFFYCQFMVIWYGNISEETAYVIARTMASPWRPMAWLVFIVSFGIPFLILLNRKIKSNPKWMSLLSALVLLGLWLEHTLLIGPSLNPHVHTLQLGIFDGLIFVGFIGLMTLVVASVLHVLPELAESRISEGS